MRMWHFSGRLDGSGMERQPVECTTDRGQNAGEASSGAEEGASYDVCENPTGVVHYYNTRNQLQSKFGINSTLCPVSGNACGRQCRSPQCQYGVEMGCIPELTQLICGRC